MIKFIKLLQNENKKEMKKISTKIFIIVSILSIILAVCFVMLVKMLTNFATEETESYWKEYVQSDIDMAQAELTRAKENKDTQLIADLESQIKIYKYAIENELNLYGMTTEWRADAIYKLIEEEVTLHLYEAQKGLIEEQEINKQKEKVDKLYEMINKNDFESYMNAEIEILKNSLDEKEITKEEYDSKLEVLELTKKYEIGKDSNNDNAWKQEVIAEIEKIKEELRTNFNAETKKVISYEQRQEKEETLKIDLYRLENNIPPISQTLGETNYRNYFDIVAESFSISILAILIIMMAGASMSSEFSKGTIKFLVMTPYKRWKILFAKLMNIIIIMIVLTIVLSFASMLIGSIFFGNENTYPYLYVQNGEVKALNHTIYTVLRYLTYDIDILIYLLFALMLSVITRNTAVSTGVSIATYLGNGIVMSILNMFITADWIKFIPFNNMALTDKIFTNTTTLMTTEVTRALNNVTVTFSLAVLGVTAILMIITMFDSFNKRDIK